MHEHGFDAVTRLREARQRLREHCQPHGRTEDVSVADADGRWLAAPASASRAVPHYDRAAMDGYAVRAADTFGASGGSPIRLDRTDGAVEPGTARRVHTGSPVPEGADAVVVVEHVEDRNGRVAVYDAVAGGENVAPAGEDVEAGQSLFDAGHRLRPSDLALLRSAGVETVPVAAPPTASVVPTGEELVPPGTEPRPGEVVETNGLQISRLVERWGGRATYRDVVEDDEDALRAALRRDVDHDVVVTTGGSSVGERDLLPEVVADLGDLLVHGVAVKPGHPVGFGVVEDTPVLVLPGYPVSCLVTAVQLLRPAIAWLAGAEPASMPVVRARLATKVPSAPGERTFARVRLSGQRRSGPGGSTSVADADDLPEAEPVSASGAGVLSTVAFADGWVEVPEDREGLPAGEVVAVQRWEE